MSTEKVQVFMVNQNTEKQKKDGSSYKATILITNVGEKLILQSSVDRTPDMKAALESINSGDTVTLVHQARPGSKFTNVVGVYVGDVPDAQPQQQSGGFTGNSGGFKGGNKSSYDNTGMQVGHAINNAVLLLAHKVTKGTIETVSEDILRLSEKLKANLLAGRYKVDNNNVTAVTRVEPAVIQDQDIPWMDD